MLYNPKWKAPRNIWSNASFVAWLKTQPSTGSYPYMDNYNCLIAQYLKACGATNATHIWSSIETRQEAIIVSALGGMVDAAGLSLAFFGSMGSSPLARTNAQNS